MINSKQNGLANWLVHKRRTSVMTKRKKIEDGKRIEKGQED